jgi:hypothetical protein
LTYPPSNSPVAQIGQHMADEAVTAWLDLRWYTVATTAEGTGGAFSFTIKGTATGAFDYRAVVSDLPGYLQFGYSPARSLHVTS